MTFNQTITEKTGTMPRIVAGAFLAAVLLATGGRALADVDLPTKFGNHSTVGNTRHNMSQRQTAGGGPFGVVMDAYRSDYGEVCVYCHTPHGSSPVAVPLWNRTIAATTYQLYSSDSLNGPVTQPGTHSLACLSCHDGQVAVDSIINMPGSGRYKASQWNTSDTAFLNTWANPSGTGPFVHARLAESQCLACHSPDAGVVGAGATDFRVAALGTDLRNDHPVGVRYPAPGANLDFRDMTTGGATAKFFDTNGNGRLDTNEVRTYPGVGGFNVECATCHDPHGVPTAGRGSPFIPGFLRVANTGSTLCLACHVK